jgi:hypothetical protein
MQPGAALRLLDQVPGADVRNGQARALELPAEVIDQFYISGLSHRGCVAYTVSG